MGEEWDKPPSIDHPPTAAEPPNLIASNMAKTLSKKGACSSNTQSAKGNCLKHNRREGNIASYVDQTRTKDNITFYESEVLKKYKSIKPLEERARKLYTEKTGQKCQDKFAPFKETVLVVKPGITQAQMDEYRKNAEALTGWKCLGLWFHQDEGHTHSKWIEGNTNFQINYHVHCLWDAQDHETGKIIRPKSRAMFSQMQDVLAAAVGMERGNYAKDTGRTHRGNWEERQHQYEQRIEQLTEAYKAKLKAAESEHAAALDKIRADYEKQIQRLEKRLKRYDERKDEEKKQHQSASWFSSKNQKIIDKLESENKDLREELMDVRMHSWGEDARKISSFWREQCRALDPVLTRTKEEEISKAYEEKQKTRQVIAVPAVTPRPRLKREEEPQVKEVKKPEQEQDQEIKRGGFHR